MMVAFHSFGTVSYPVRLDDMGLELLDSMGEKRARIKREGRSFR
jgi:hypothetical protein